MKVERLSKFVEKPEIHRKVLGEYRGGYALGVTEAPGNRKAALSLSVEGDDIAKFPREVEIDGESVPVIIQRNWTVPRPLKKITRG
ncbi:MAG: hypothetical protein ABWZ66_11630 [Pyrinomonadaceae bacterium]